MRIIRTIATAMSIAMLAFTFLACEDEEKKQTKAGAESVATEQPKKPETASSPEEVASLYVASGAKMDIETMKKITTGQMLEKMIATESMLRMTASSAGKSYESYLKELQTETISRGELVIKSATKASDDGKHARVIVYAGKKGDALEVPTAIVLAKDGGKWKVIDTPK